MTGGVKRTFVRALAVSGLLSMLAVGCGEDRADPAPAVASCNAYCDAYLAAACSAPNYTSGGMCKEFECGTIATSPATCVDEFKAYYDCVKVLTAADLCCETVAPPATRCDGLTVPVPCSDKYNALLVCNGR